MSYSRNDTLSSGRLRFDLPLSPGDVPNAGVGTIPKRHQGEEGRTRFRGWETCPASLEQGGVGCNGVLEVEVRYLAVYWQKFIRFEIRKLQKQFSLRPIWSIISSIAYPDRRPTSS